MIDLELHLTHNLEVRYRLAHMKALFPRFYLKPHVKAQIYEVAYKSVLLEYVLSQPITKLKASRTLGGGIKGTDQKILGLR